MNQKDVMRFWSKVNKRDEDDCWEWQAGKLPQGYGLFKIQGLTQRAHRLAYQLSRHNIPDGLFVLHSCDNPPCVNPKHLFIGTHQDNMNDMKRKGRLPNRIGENNYNAKLSKIQVEEMRQLKAAGVTYQELMKIYGISNGQVSNIITGKNW